MDNNPKNIALIIIIIICVLIYTLMTLQEGWLLMHNISYINISHKISQCSVAILGNIT